MATAAYTVDYRPASWSTTPFVVVDHKGNTWDGYRTLAEALDNRRWQPISANKAASDVARANPVLCGHPVDSRFLDAADEACCSLCGVDSRQKVD